MKDGTAVAFTICLLIIASLLFTIGQQQTRKQAIEKVVKQVYVPCGRGVKE